MKQLHKRFTDGQSKVLLRCYCQGILRGDKVQEMLGISKSQSFTLLREYRQDPEAFLRALSKDYTSPALCRGGDGD